MLAQIMIHTPLWVWALLVFLIYRGLLASVERTMPLQKTFLIPLAMLGLSLYGIGTAFGTQPAALLAWLAGVLATGMLTRLASDGGVVAAYPRRNTVVLRGSWMPLALMMGIFWVKYAVAATLTLYPAVGQNLAFALSVRALYGVFNGIFLGRLLLIVAAWRQAHAAVAIAAA